MTTQEAETIPTRLRREATEKEAAAAVLANVEVGALLRREAGELRELASRLEREAG